MYDNGECEISSKSEEENEASLLGLGGLSLGDKGWISPPGSISSGSSESGGLSADVNLADSSNGSDVADSLLLLGSSAEVKESAIQVLSSGPDLQENLSPGPSGATTVQVHNCDATTYFLTDLDT